MKADSYKLCVICGQELGPGQRWLLLNRYGMGSGVARVLIEARMAEAEIELRRLGGRD